MRKFVVAEIKDNEVIGYNGDYPIWIGEIFEFLKYYKHPEKLEDWQKEPELTKSIPVLLQVVEIKMYDKKLEELPPGCSGVLTLEGKGLELIEHEAVLETDELRPEYDFSKLELKPIRGRYAKKFDSNLQLFYTETEECFIEKTERYDNEKRKLKD